MHNWYLCIFELISLYLFGLDIYITHVKKRSLIKETGYIVLDVYWKLSKIPRV